MDMPHVKQAFKNMIRTRLMDIATCAYDFALDDVMC